MTIQDIRRAPAARTAALPDGTLARVLTARGAIAGCFGAGTVALWFLLIDTVTRTPLWSPSLMGGTLLLGASPSASIGVDLGLVAGFSLVHCLLFAAFGIAATFVLHGTRVRPGSLIGIAGLAAGLQAGFALGAYALAPGLGEALGWLYVGGGNVAAAVSMAVCLGALPDPADVAGL
jgi:hypothetical protein